MASRRDFETDPPSLAVLHGGGEDVLVLAFGEAVERGPPGALGIRGDEGVELDADQGVARDAERGACRRIGFNNLLFADPGGTRTMHPDSG